MAININKLLPAKIDKTEKKPIKTGGINIDKLLPKKKPSLPTKEAAEVKKPTIYGNIPTKPFADIKGPLPPSQKVNYGALARIVNVPGGGQYWTDEKMYQTGEKKGYGTLEQKKDMERDHIVPASLGGTSFDVNLQYLKNNKTVIEKLFDKEGQWKNRQEGKMVVELKNIQDYQKGEISLDQARKNIADWNKTPVNKVKDFINKIIPKKEPMVFNVGEGLSSSQKQIANQVVRQDIKTPGVEIKAPFIQKGIMQQEGTVSEIIKGLVELPEKVAKSLVSVPYTISTGKPLEYKKKNWEVKTYQQDAKVLADAVIDGRASLLDAFLLPVTAGVDLLFVGSLINSGLKKVAIGAPLDKAEIVASRKALGLGDKYTAEQLDKTYKNLIRSNHPDIGGSAAVAVDINKARTILKADLAAQQNNQGLLYNLRRTADELTKNVKIGVKNVKTPAPEPKLIGDAKPTIPATETTALARPKVDIDKILPKTTPQTPITAPVKPQEAITEVLEPKTTKVLTEPIKAEIKAEEPLIAEARKYKSAEEFVKAQTKQEYRSAHQLGLSDSITDKIDIPTLKEAIRTRNGYLNNYNLSDLKKLEKLQNNPDAEVTIYRASPKNELNDGDWVTIDKTYANDIKRQNGGKVFSYTVKVKDLRFPKDTETLPSLSMASTFSYSPKTSQLTDIWNKAQEKPALPEKISREQIADKQLEALNKKIDSKLLKFRKESGLMAKKEGAGVKYRAVEDAVGDVGFVAKDFSLNRAKASMKQQRIQNEKYANELLLENDADYRAMVEKRDELLSRKIEKSNEIDVSKIFDDVSDEIETLKTNIKEYENTQVQSSETKEVRGIERESPKETGGVKKESGVAKSIEAKAIEQGFVDKGFDTLSGFNSTTIKEQAEKVAKLMENIEDAKMMIRGDKPLPADIRSGALLSAMEDYAKKTLDAELMYDLANSPLATEISESASELSLARMREKDSATIKLQEIKKAREAKVRNAQEKKTALKKNLKEEVKKINLSKEELQWDKFLDDIKC